MIDRDALVAALCVRSAAIEPDSPVYSALIDGLVEQMDQKSSARRTQIINRIVQSKHPRVPEVLLRDCTANGRARPCWRSRVGWNNGRTRRGKSRP